MKKLLKLILITFLLITNKVYAANLSTSISCPNTAITGSVVSCSIGANTSDGSLGSFKANYSFSNASLETFSGGSGWSTLESSVNGFALLNTSGVSGYTSLGTLRVKVTGGVGSVSTVTLNNIDASDTDFNSIDSSNASSNITIIEEQTQVVTTAPSTSILVDDTTQVTTAPITTHTTTRPTTTKIISNTTTTTKVAEPVYLDSLSVIDHPFNFDKLFFDYNIEVESDVASIDIKTTFSSNYLVLGDGIKELNYGENVFEITVQDHKNNKNTYKLTVLRKSSNLVKNTLDDVEKSLLDFDDITINLDINEANKIAYNEILELIKNKKKRITYNIVKSNKIMYTWIFDGSKFKSFDKDVNLQLDFNLNNKEKVTNLVDDDDFLLLNFAYKGDLPSGTEVKVNLGDVYPVKKNVNLYYFDEDNNKIKLITEDLKIINGYVSFTLSHCSDYILSVLNLKSNSSSSMILFLAIFVVTLEIVGIIFLIKRNKNNKYNNNNKFGETVEIPRMKYILDNPDFVDDNPHLM